MALKYNVFSWKLLFLGSLLTLSFVLPLSLHTSNACAGGGGGGGGGAAPTTPCDPQYMDALEARAWLEAQREIAQNQNLIVKPDSVLEYTCFDRLIGRIAYNWSDRPFSETTRWGNVANQGNTSLDNAIQNVTGNSLNNYINTNFSHNYLGGRDTVGVGRTIDTITNGATAAVYTCVEMQLVWNLARCSNFFNATADGPGVAAAQGRDAFFDFQAYVGWDPRRQPTGGACTSPITANWIDMAFNNQSNRYTLAAENLLDGVAYNTDPIVTYFTLINPVTVAPAVTCAPGIPTGVVITRNNFTPSPYNEHICPNPGCYYVPSNTTTGHCQQ